jgi:hypothetical protein
MHPSCRGARKQYESGSIGHGRVLCPQPGRGADQRRPQRPAQPLPALLHGSPARQGGTSRTTAEQGLLSAYLAHRAAISRAHGPLFLSESRRNHVQSLSLWTWSKVVRQIALDVGVPQFSTHTLQHLCLTDLARMGWEIHAIAAFAGHRHTDSTLTYIICPVVTWPASCADRASRLHMPTPAAVSAVIRIGSERTTSHLRTL